MTSVNAPYCDTGACLEVHIDGDATTLWESERPDIRVVTTTASWQGWLNQAKAPVDAELAIVRTTLDTVRKERDRAFLLLRRARIHLTEVKPLVHEINALTASESEGDIADDKREAFLANFERGEFDDLAASDE